MDRARSYSDAPDASVRIFGRESAGEMYEARFGCPVSSKFRGGPFDDPRSLIDNKLGLQVYHTGEEYASEPIWTENIHSDLRYDTTRIHCMRRREIHSSSNIDE